MRADDALRFFLERRDAPDGSRTQFEAERARFDDALPRCDPTLLAAPKTVDGDVNIVLLPVVNYLAAMQARRVLFSVDTRA